MSNAQKTVLIFAVGAVAACVAGAMCKVVPELVDTIMETDKEGGL